MIFKSQGLTDQQHEGAQLHSKCVSPHRFRSCRVTFSVWWGTTNISWLPIYLLNVALVLLDLNRCIHFNTYSSGTDLLTQVSA